LVLESEAADRRSTSEAVEVTSRRLDVSKAAGFFVVVQTEFTAKTSDDS
jgi:hypothetical protein